MLNSQKGIGMLCMLRDSAVHSYGKSLKYLRSKVDQV